MIYKTFSRDYTLYIGSDFHKEILLEDIWVDWVQPGMTCVVHGGAVKSTDSTEAFILSGTVEEDNTKLVLDMSVNDTYGIPSDGKYKYAVDIEADGVVKTVLTGILHVEEDLSDV
jgi:hypothetical protein